MQKKKAGGRRLSARVFPIFSSGRERVFSGENFLRAGVEKSWRDVDEETEKCQKGRKNASAAVFGHRKSENGPRWKSWKEKAEQKSLKFPDPDVEN